MTKVTFFEDFYYYEYHTRRGAVQRFRYWLCSPVYDFPLPVTLSFTTEGDFSFGKAVYSSDFLPSRISERWRDSENDQPIG